MTLTAAAKVGAVDVSLVKIKAISVGAAGPGEVAGPALAVSVRVKNRSAKAINVSSANVTMIDENGQVGVPTPNAPAAPFKGVVKSHASASGVYVFTIAKSARNPINVYVSYAVGAKVAHFVGNAKRNG